MLVLTNCQTSNAQTSQPEIESAENLIVVTLDGLRREELFTGADQRLMTKDAGGVRDAKSLKSRFWRDKAEDRRKALMPFMWTTLVQQGQMIGDPEMGSQATCTNGLYFSYPGYNELLCGFADAKVVSNAKIYNSNKTVLEWINERPTFKGKVAAFCSWDVFPFIINTQRSGISVNAGWQELTVGNANELTLLNRAARETPHVWPNVRFDLFTVDGALHYLRAKNPRVLYISLGETDDWAHDGRYDLYLDAAYRSDQHLKRIWETVQKIPQYKDKTAMLISTDHGRGDGREGWKNHGVHLKGSENIWMAALGKGVTALGNRRSMKITQSQFASTAAALLGLNFDEKGVAVPIQMKAH